MIEMPAMELPPEPPESAGDLDEARLTPVGVLQLLAILATALFFLLLAYSYFIPAKAFYVLEAKTEHLSFTVSKKHPEIEVNIEGMAIFSDLQGRIGKCVNGSLEVLSGTEVQFEYRNAKSRIVLKVPPSETINGPAQTGAIVHIKTGDQVPIMSGDKLALEPNTGSECYTGEPDASRFSRFSLIGPGIIGRPPTDLARARMEGTIEIFAEGWFRQPLSGTRSITDVTARARSIPYGAAIAPLHVRTPWERLKALFSSNEEPKSPDMIGHITQEDGAFKVTATTSARALEVLSPSLRDGVGLVRVGVMELFYAEPMLAILLGFFPMTTLSLSILNKGGAGPKQTTKMLLALLLARRGK